MTEPRPADREAPTALAGVGSGNRRRWSPDSVTIGFLALAAFLLVLALLGSQLTSAGSALARSPVVVRKIYRTTVLEKVLPTGSGPKDGTSVTQSSSPSPVAEPAAAAPVTRVS